MSRKTIALFLAIAAITAMTGCTEPPTEESSFAASSTQSESSSQEPEKTYTYYEHMEPIKGFQSQHIRWDADGGFSVRQKDTILFVDHDNEPVKTFRPVDRSGPDLSWVPSDEDWGDPTFCEYIWNETYVLACFHLYGSLDAVVYEKNGLPTLADAVIYTMDGRLVKVFPSTDDQDVKNRSDNKKYAWMISSRTCCDWLDDDILAINSGDAIWLYSVSRDEIKQAADSSQDLWAAWCRGESYAFGISNEQCWAENGKLYYAVGHGLPGATEDQYGVGYSLWSVGWDSPPTCLSGDKLHHEYKLKNGVLFAANYHLEQVGADTMWICDIERLDENTGEYIAIGTDEGLTGVAIRQDLVVHTTYRRETPDEKLQCTIHCLDFQSGEKRTWEPIMPETKGDAYATMLDVCRIPDGIRLYYYVEDIYDTGRTVTLVTYDTTTDQAIFTPIDSQVEIPPSEEAPTRFLETDKYGRVRLRPLP